jgi:hypothetical protein
MATLASPEKLAGMLKSAPEEYAKLKKDCEAACARWIWSKGPVVFDVPYESELDGSSSPGEPYTKAPARPKPGDVETGYDDSGRALVVREHGSQKSLHETFFRHDDSSSKKWIYSAPRKVASVGELRRKEGRVVDAVLLSPYAGISRHVDYHKDGRPASIAARRTNRGIYASKNEKPVDTTAVFEYDDRGLKRITTRGATPKPVVVFERPNRPLPKILKSLETRLLQEIPLTVSRLRLKKPAFALALVYDGETEHGVLPPMLAVGLEADRERWRKQGEGEPESLWIPHALGTFEDDRLEIDDPRIESEAEEAVAHLSKSGDIAPARKLLIDLAKGLNAISWDGILQTTKDFVVYPIDLGAEDLKENFAKAVPPARLKELQRRGEI